MNPYFLILLAGTCPLLSPAAPQRRNASIPGRYLVTLKPESSPAQHKGHTSRVQDMHARTCIEDSSPGERQSK